MRRAALFLVLLAPLAAGCDLLGTRGGPTADVAARAGRTFQLREGQSARLGGSDHRIRFERVARDGRCPTDVDCFWEGEALLVMGRSHPVARYAGPDTLTTLSPRPGYRYADSLVAGPYVVRLRALDPHLRVGEPRPARYTATFALAKR